MFLAAGAFLRNEKEYIIKNDLTTYIHMKHWLIAIIILVFQEVVSLNALIFETHRGAYNPWTIHIIFLFVSAFDIWIGFVAGRWVQKKYHNGKIIRFVQKWSDRFEAYAGKKGKRAALLVLGFISYPYINSFIASWLDVSFAEMFIFIFIADVLWYIAAWLVILGVTAFVPNPVYALLIVIALSLLIVFFSRRKKV